MKKYLITKTTLRFKDGTSDILENKIPTDDINAERQRLINEYKCDKVHFRFNEIGERSTKAGDVKIYE